MSTIGKSLKITDKMMQKIIDILQNKLKDFDGIFGRKDVSEYIGKEYLYERENLTTNKLDLNFCVEDFLRVKFRFSIPQLFRKFSGSNILVTYGIIFNSPTYINIKNLEKFFDTSTLDYKLSLFQFKCADRDSKLYCDHKNMIPEMTGVYQYCLYLEKEINWKAFNDAVEDDGVIKNLVKNIFTHRNSLYSTLWKYTNHYWKDEKLIYQIKLSNKYELEKQ